MSLLTIVQLGENYGGVGDHDADNLQMAIDLAEFDIFHAINTPLEPTTFTEEHQWPHGKGDLKLSKRKVTALTTVTAKHSLDADCIWTEDTECGVILDSNHGWVRLIGCSLTLTDCNCSYNTIVPDRAVVTYVAGYTAAESDPSTAVGKALRMAIALRAREWLVALEAGDFFEGEAAVTSWSSMDYSEQRELADVMNPLGPGPLSQTAWRILDKLTSYTSIMIRGPGLV
ncbi:MAG: hypothetical protein ACXABY_05745 [Candidatus Thorarchaeota archaeon]|jgi:hypothetical protein